MPTVRKHILVVDDDPLVRETVRLKLEDFGFRVSLADDGETAMLVLADVRPDVVITDIIMPIKEGIETILEIKRNYPGIPVICMSGGGRLEAADVLQTALIAGADAALSKPFTDHDLKIVLTNCGAFVV